MSDASHPFVVKEAGSASGNQWMDSIEKSSGSSFVIVDSVSSGKSMGGAALGPPPDAEEIDECGEDGDGEQRRDADTDGDSGGGGGW